MKTLIITILCSASIALAVPPEVRQEAIQMVTAAKDAGALRIEGSNAWVNPIFWEMMDAQIKQRFTLACAVYHDSSSPDIDIYDSQSAKKIAHWDGLFGFKVY